MKLRFLVLLFFGISLFMYCTWEYLVPYCDTTSIYWFFAKDRKWNPKAKILVLGDSQIVSGILPETIAEIESVNLDEVLFLPRPSQQPEGILSDTLCLTNALPNLRKVYVNISPLNTSKNSITDAHKQLYYSFGDFEFHHITEPLLRKAYFSNLADLSWKFVINLFPYFGLSSNTNRIFYDPIVKEDLTRRRLEFDAIQKSMRLTSGAWIWKSISEDPILKEGDKFPNLDTTILSGKRELSIQLWVRTLQEWNKQKLDVVILRIPFSPQMEMDLKEKNAYGVTDSFIEWMERTQFQNRRFVYDFRSSFLKDYGYFADLTHLNQKGRDAFGNLLKKTLLDHTNSSAKGM
ncbi:hypothetical protein CH354_01255 [Leptospira levettii]|uniref:hypothetical protein n=1 Tax=Leptospira levettii TaxID=2023178 RepID=UPI000C2AAFBF|nr:hypothetical protein [Leptospira levettii]PJZ39060.1 hypothetical protein CH354_01255 [Leptospira levettii]PJZ87374.1 hypothetical protein CH368_17190 [Leptospira levettii]PKA01602.1 hypothetical protein CH369_06065 [Leptospira levettii]